MRSSDGALHAFRPTPLRVALVAHDLGRGGAARATARVAEALAERRAELGVETSLHCVSGPRHPLGPEPGYPMGLARGLRYASSLRRRVADRLPWTPATSELHSRADVWTGLGRMIDHGPAEVVNLHWLGTGTLSIEEIGRIRRPLVLSLHDMWAFSGAEHYSYDERYRSGYRRGTRPPGERGMDWNRHVWRRKRRAWRRPMHVITPSAWLADCVRRSALMAGWPVTVVPHALDSALWYPSDPHAARAALGLPATSLLVLTGADGGVDRHVKGGDLLEDAFRHLGARLDVGGEGVPADLELVVFGGRERVYEPAGRLPVPVHHLGSIVDDDVLRLAYSACDVMVVPSRLEAYGQTAAEALACGTPVVAFSSTGLSDIVEDGVSGRLAAPYEASDLAECIRWVIVDRARSAALGAAGRASIADRSDPSRVARSYAEVLRAAARDPLAQQ